MNAGIIFLAAMAVMILSQLLQQSINQKKRHQEIMDAIARLSEKRIKQV